MTIYGITHVIFRKVETLLSAQGDKMDYCHSESFGRRTKNPGCYAPLCQ